MLHPGKDVSAEEIDRLLRGAVDLHCHSGPSVMKRKLDHLQQIEEAEAAGMRAILFKDHFHAVGPVLDLIRHHRPPSELALLSGVPLNNALGGLNPETVAHGLEQGARLVWMPTLSSSNHMHTAHRYDLAGKLGMHQPEELSILTSRGQIRDEVKEILDLIARHDAVLSGGHLHISEMYPLFDEAIARGVTRRLVAHPTFWIEANLDDLRELGRMGVYMEHCACMLVECASRMFYAEDLRAYADAGGVDYTILGSDLGQPNNPNPVAGFRAVIELCFEAGFTSEEARAMTGGNAARLMGLDPLPA
ncbi:hypothetical protein GLS40_11680 [Pseudooceanicola sp. 216_PA32_1]|uniref:Amidohydrolase n=1 Tax=Pseudooceanicola pacificus TaxID=2676438 RepID=A0A844WG28_9RHOB|nr:DUF6282 family protein [Pseudooceanicola pacificus]MWB78689.1 hypothetical protein [Pseudooceanicola pacificus]